MGAADAALAESVWARATRRRSTLEQGGAVGWPSTALEGDTFMDNKALKLAACMRLGLRPPDPIAPCRCGEGKFDEYHFLSCKKNAAAKNCRHDTVVQRLASWVRVAGGSAAVEPRSLDPASERRTDIHATLGGRDFMVDVTIRHLEAPSHRPRDPNAVVEGPEREKSQKHARLAREKRAVVVPFVVTTVGGMGGQARDFVRLLSTGARANGVDVGRAQIATSLFAAVAAGNSLCLLSSARYNGYGHNLPPVQSSSPSPPRAEDPKSPPPKTRPGPRLSPPSASPPDRVFPQQATSGPWLPHPQRRRRTWFPRNRQWRDHDFPHPQRHRRARSFRNTSCRTAPRHDPQNHRTRPCRGSLHRARHCQFSSPHCHRRPQRHPRRQCRQACTRYSHRVSSGMSVPNRPGAFPHGHSHALPSS